MLTLSGSPGLPHWVASPPRPAQFFRVSGVFGPMPSTSPVIPAALTTRRGINVVLLGKTHFVRSLVFPGQFCGVGEITYVTLARYALVWRGARGSEAEVCDAGSA